MEAQEVVLGEDVINPQQVVPIQRPLALHPNDIQAEVDRILQTINVFDIFNFITISPLHLQLAQNSLRIPVKSINIHESTVSIVDVQDRTFHFKFHAPNPKTNRYIDGIPIHVEFDQLSVIITTPSQHNDRIWQLLILFIGHVFVAGTWGYTNKYGGFRDLKLLLQICNGVFQKMRIYSESPSSELEVSPEDLQLCMQHSYADSSKFFRVKVNGVYTGGISHRKIIINGASWLRVETLLQMNCEEILTMGASSITPGDFREFLWFWQNSGFLRNLKQLVFLELRNFIMDRALYLLDSFTWTPPMRFFTKFGDHDIHPTETRYIRRWWDGTLAAVANYRERFVMFVLDDEFLRNYEEEEKEEEQPPRPLY